MLLVVGSSGLVGQNIARCFRESGRPVFTASHRPGADLHLDLAAEGAPLTGISREVRHAVICSGITDVDKCLRERESAWTFNVERTTALIAGLQDSGITVVFCSSDMVFTGDRGGYRENEAPLPATEYGRQKKAVEDFLASRSAPSAILRMSKLYSRRASKGSLINDTLTALRSGTVRAATDQVIVPTLVDDVASTVMAIMDRRLSGVFHVSPRQRYFRYDLVRLVADTAGIADRLAACSLDDIPFLDRRPKKLWLNGEETEARTGVRPVELAEILDTLVAQAGTPALRAAALP